MLIEFTKLTDGGILLRCVRTDGTSVWQRQEGARGRFFAFHDLRHYAVESVLEYKQGFYGLISSGWEILDTTGKGSRGPLPDEALEVEHLVGLLDAESTGENQSTAELLNEYAAASAAKNSRHASRALTEATLARIRELAASLHSEWSGLLDGVSMRLTFPPDQ